MDLPSFKGISTEMEDVILNWLTFLLCGKAEKRKILLCYHSRDEGNIKRFLKSLHSIKAEVTCRNERTEKDADYINFSNGVVLMCLSKEYATSQEQQQDYQLASSRQNELALITFDPMIEQWQNIQNNLLIFDDVDRPSVFTLRRNQKGYEKYIYVSNHPSNATEAKKVCEILQKCGVKCSISNYRSISEINKEVLLRVTEEINIATNHLVILSRDYLGDEFCQFERTLIRNTGRRFHAYNINVNMSDINSLDMAWVLPYEEDKVVLETTLKHACQILRVRKEIVLISSTDKYRAERCREQLKHSKYKYNTVYFTSDLNKNQKCALIAECEIFVACFSKSYFEDTTCRKDMELAAALWKRILPVESNENSVSNRPEWLVRIVGHLRYPDSLEDYFEDSAGGNETNRRLEDWIRKKITIPCKSFMQTKLPPLNDDSTMTDAYGSVEVFAEGGLEHYIAQYVRLSTTTHLNVLLSLLMKQWGLRRPRLLISITGEGLEILNDPRKTRFFTSALENIVREKGVWFTTDGATSEISKVIGQVVEKENVNTRPTVIGIASWEFLKMNRALLVKNGFGRWPAQYNTREAATAPGDYHLNPFCTHFLLPEKSVENVNGSGYMVSTARLRADLEEYIRRGRFELNKPEEDDSVEVPSVLLVVEGDQYQSVSMIRRSLDAGRHVVVLKGTGGLADILASITEHQIRTQDSKLMEIVNHQNSRCLIFVDLNDETCEFDMVLIEVLLRDVMESNEKKLRLTLAFNSSEKAKEHVFAKNKPNLTDAFKNQLMIRAMKDGKKDFVRLLIKECVDINKFTRENYHKLFKADDIPEELKRQMGWDVEPTEENVIRFVVRILQIDVFMSYDLGDRNDPVRAMTFTNEGLIDTLKHRVSSDSQSDPYFYLLVWSILMMNLQELAKFFWQHCKEPLPSALIACGIYRTMRKKCQPANKLLADRLLESELEFQSLACGVLSQFYKDNPDETERMLTRKRPRWRNLTCLEIAYKMKVHSFMTHEACKIPINRVWYGQISPDNSALQLIISVFFLGLFPFVLKYVKSNSGKKDDANCITRIGKRIYNFYTAPIMRFSHTMASYMIFLAFFSYSLLTGFGDTITWVEILMYCWVFCLMLDEVRELLYGLSDSKKQLGEKYISERPYMIQIYFQDKWNYFDVTILCFFTIGAILDVLGYYETIEVGRVFLAISLIAFFMRILKTFSALEELGPKVWMIASMAKDLLYFVIILMLFVVSYAVAAYSIMYPRSELSFDLLLNVMRLGYWNLYGELLLEDIEVEEPDCSFNETVYNAGTLPRCAVKHRKIIGLVMMGIYLIFANVMLLNILIAMFTDTYQRIQEKRDHKWNYERYALVREFRRYPVIPMPLGVPLFLFYLVKGIYNKCKQCNTVRNHDKELMASLKVMDVYFSLEREMVYLYMKKRSEDAKESALTEETIAKVVAIQVEKKLSRLQSNPGDPVDMEELTETIIKQLTKKK
ncbi:transient receptor potential cation channel subfamily M member-like 2 [Saccostrea echinata]|uniref:transient receptor potential cation channel subfamily M member-like 2 n=1 Tax=Saccostrea echinata TaxID=191078 RepID=UPI002A813E02|nr:transient receptor potential cation channel subfamily M member-like 2 [Saccostrea echinata]